MHLRFLLQLSSDLALSTRKQAISALYNSIHPSHVIFSSSGLDVKYGGDITVTVIEAQTQMMVCEGGFAR